MRLRATRVSDKQARREAILDAAERLLEADPSRSSVVQELADAAAIAKGTVYLYFPSKEELLLAVHQRHADQFFDAFEVRLSDPAPVDFDAVLAVARRHLIGHPTYLPLCARINGMMDKDLPPPVACRFKQHIAQRLLRAGALLERRLPGIAAGGGADVLIRSYALIVGMWLLLHPIPHLIAEYDRQQFSFFKRDFTAEAEIGLRALWAGLTSPAVSTSTSGEPA